MSGLTSLASTAIRGLSIANALIGSTSDYYENSGQRAYEQGKEKSDLSLRNLQESNALEKQKIKLSAEVAEKERRLALRRAMAKQRAQYGASGISSGDGSAQAVLLGLFDESEEEARQREALDALRAAEFDQNYAQQKRVNTLQLTQFKERNRLNKVQSQLGAAADIGGMIF